ncbi:MAG: MarR family transcriptional regulator [Oscillospiraceae bacterium]|nr:MarR family transcriptional regulator [Oscillospiraceae bacterium]
MNSFDSLKLENQLCFPLYAASKEVIKQYVPLLEDLDLTYTQYLSMLVLWEKDGISVKEMGEKLLLDSGTLTPVLKSLERKGYVERQRCRYDERIMIISLTDAGRFLKERALNIPARMASCIELEPDEAKELYRLLYKLLSGLDQK